MFVYLNLYIFKSAKKDVYEISFLQSISLYLYSWNIISAELELYRRVLWLYCICYKSENVLYLPHRNFMQYTEIRDNKAQLRFSATNLSKVGAFVGHQRRPFFMITDIPALCGLLVFACRLLYLARVWFRKKKHRFLFKISNITISMVF